MALNTSSGFSQIVGNFIDAWDDKIVETYANSAPLLNDAKFQTMKMVGGVYHVATRLTFEGGHTYAAARANVGEGSSVYNNPRTGYVPDAQVEAPQFHGRSRLTYEAIARSMEGVDASGPDGKKAVREATKVVVDGLLGGSIKKLEAEMIHGRQGWGQLDSAVNASNVVNSVTDLDGTAGFGQDVNISAETWSDGLWMAFEGHAFDFYDNSSGSPGTTKQNTSANTQLATSGETGCILVAVNPATPLTNGTANGRALRFYHTAGSAGVVGTGYIGAGSAWLLAGSAMHIFPQSASTTTEFIGLLAMAANTGTMFNIAGGTYGMYRGNPVTSVGNLRLSDLIRYCAKPINAGAGGKKLRAVVPTELFSKFANDEATLRRYGAATGDAKNGFDSLEMYLPYKSVLEIMGHPLQKDGRALVYTVDEVMRVGSQDLDMVRRTGKGRSNDILLEVGDRPSSELRCYAQFAPICATPRHMLSLTGITY